MKFLATPLLPEYVALSRRSLGFCFQRRPSVSIGCYSESRHVQFVTIGKLSNGTRPPDLHSV